MKRFQMSKDLHIIELETSVTQFKFRVHCLDEQIEVLECEKNKLMRVVREAYLATRQDMSVENRDMMLCAAIGRLDRETYNEMIEGIQ